MVAFAPFLRVVYLNIMVWEKFSRLCGNRVVPVPGWLSALLKHLVLPHPVCLGAVVGPHRFPTRGAERLAFDCDARGVSVEGTRFGAVDGSADMTLAADGILYMLDDVPIPRRGALLLRWWRSDCTPC